MSIVAETGMNFETTLAPGPCQVELDTRQFFQVLENIITNAREAMPLGGRLKIAIDRVEPLYLSIFPPWKYP